MVTDDQKHEILTNILDKCEKEECYLLFATIAGSHAYGLATENSDIDARFVYLAPDKHYLGFGSSSDTIQVKGQDIVGYEFKKFVKLAMANNPNVLELLFSNKNILRNSFLFRPIYDYRKAFLSKLIHKTFLGYALGQLDKAKRCTKEAVEKLEWYEDQLTKIGLDLSNLSVKQEVRDKIVQVEQGTNPHESPTIGRLIDDYLSFKKEKWPYNDLGNKRREHVKKYGYDSKNISHTIRLLTMAEEVFCGEGLKVERPDRDYLLAIKNGEFSLHELESSICSLKNRIYDAVEQSNLPDEPNYDRIEAFVIDILKDYLYYA